MIVEMAADLVEGAVFLGLRRLESADPATFHAFRCRQDALYAIPNPQAQDRAFLALHAEIFAHLGFEHTLTDALHFFEAFPRSLDRFAFLKAKKRSDEGAELFVRQDPSGITRSATARLLPETLLDEPRCRRLLLHELTHIADMVDPAFGYDPDIGPEETPAQTNLIRDRYRVLWNLYVEARLEKKAEGGRQKAEGEFPQTPFNRAFAGIPPQARDAIVQRMHTAPTLTHADILDMARTRVGLAFQPQ